MRPHLPNLADKATRGGVERMCDEELLALVMTSGRDESACRSVAALLLDDLGGLVGLWRCATREIAGLVQLERSRAARIAAAFELGVRCLEASTPERPAVRSTADAARILAPRLGRLEHEQVWLIGLDDASRLLGRRRVAEGGRHGCALTARDVLRVALGLGASSFVLAHNHPGGDPTPSRQDVELTRNVAALGECAGVPLVDHIVVAATTVVSMAELGLLEPASHPALLEQPRGASLEA
jgi:DNA repair protein RadC